VIAIENAAARRSRSAKASKAACVRTLGGVNLEVRNMLPAALGGVMLDKGSDVSKFPGED